MRFVRHGFAGFFLITLAALAFLPQRGPAQQQTPPDYSQSFDKTDAMIPARDGVKLHAEIYAPKNAAEPLPIILERTPYGTVNDAKGYSRKLGRYLEMIPDGYIFVFQDIRGRYGSEGKFVMQRPARNPKDPKAIDEGTDTYDTIDWLVKNVPHNNRRVGLLGISYGGWLTTRMTGICGSARYRTSTPNTCMTRCPRGVISLRTRITTASGSSRPCRISSSVPRCRTSTWPAGGTRKTSTAR